MTSMYVKIVNILGERSELSAHYVQSCASHLLTIADSNLVKKMDSRWMVGDIRI